MTIKFLPETPDIVTNRDLHGYTCEDHAQSGRNAIDAYIVETGDDRESALVDLLADLMHMANIDCEPGAQ